MNIEEMRNTDEFKAEVENSAKNLYDLNASKAIEDAVKNERERGVNIMSIEGGHNDLKIEAIKTGSSVDSLYKNLYRAEIKTKTNEQERLINKTKPVPVDKNVPVTKKEDATYTAKDFTDLIEKYQGQGFSQGKAMLKAKKENPGAHSAYIIENN